MPSRTDTAAEVAFYYDVISASYRQYWGDFFHPAFFRRAHQSLTSAYEETHRRFLRDGRVKKSSRILDLGCGVGSFSQLVAEKTGADVTGITLSSVQLRAARQRLKHQPRVRFFQADIHDLRQVGAGYDGAFLIDVGCHIKERPRAFRAIARALRPRARLVVADWLKRPHPTLLERELLLHPFERAWHFPGLASLEDMNRELQQANFRVIASQDVSYQVMPNWDRFYDVSIKELARMSLTTMTKLVPKRLLIRFGSSVFATMRQQFMANILTKVAADAGVFRYGYIVAERK